MADPARKKPYLQAVREGNPGHRKLSPGVLLPEADGLAEPDWRDVFPSGDPPGRAENLRARRVASAEWRRVVPPLLRAGLLADVDAMLLRDYCTCVARLDQGERAISRLGALMKGERGWQKSGWTTINAAYRAQLARYLRELGLSPSARTSINAPGTADDDGDDPFD